MNALAEQLEGLDRVRSVRVNAISGSILIECDDREIEPELLFAGIVRILGCEEERSRTARPMVA